MKRFTKKQKDMIEELAMAYACFDRTKRALSATPLSEQKFKFMLAVTWLNNCQNITGVKVVCLDKWLKEST